MKKRFIVLLVAIMITFTANISAAGYKYNPPYPETDGGRAALNEPIPFSYETAQKELVASGDFNDNTGGSDTLTFLEKKGGASFSDGRIKIEKTQTETPSYMTFTFSENVYENDIYVFMCDVQVSEISEGGVPRNLIQAWNNKWIAEEQGKGTSATDAQTIVSVLTVPEGTTTLRVAAYMPINVTGTVYYDNFKVYRIASDPLEAVLKSPNYKGLIYGDGEGDISLDVTVFDNGGAYSIENLELEVRLVDGNDNVLRYAIAESVSEKMNFVFSSKGIDEGDYYLQTIVKNKASGEVISKKEHTIRKRAEDYRPDTYVDENGRIIKNGEKTFLKRIMNAGGDYMKVAKAAQTAGIDTVAHYGNWWSVTNPDTEALGFMREKGITSHIALTGFVNNYLSDAAIDMLDSNYDNLLPLFANIANDYKNDSILEGYYIFDELDPSIFGEEIRWHNEILAQEDINHPTFGVADSVYENYGVYAKMTDILGIDPYPVTGKKDAEGVEIPDDISVVGDRMRHIKANFPNRPVYLVLQGFNWEARGDLRGPNEAELKNMAWQAICEGADGLDWYSYSSMLEDSVETEEAWTQKLNNVFSDVAPYEEIILSDEPTPKYSIENGGEWLNLTLRRFEGKTYVFAVNNTYESQSMTLCIDGLEERTLSFEPLEVKKIEVKQNEFLSHEAELKTMGFSNGEMSFAVAEGEENVLYVPNGSGVINYNAKISDGAKLYIGSREVPENGKITVKLVDSFKVTVVAHDGVTKSEKTYRVVKQ